MTSSLGGASGDRSTDRGIISTEIELALTEFEKLPPSEFKESSVTKLVDALLHAEGMPKTPETITLRLRCRFIALELKKCLEINENILEQIMSIYLAAIGMSNSVQDEGGCFAVAYPVLKAFHEHRHNSCFAEAKLLIAELPFAFQEGVPKEHRKTLPLNASGFTPLIDSLVELESHFSKDISEESDEFVVALMNITKGYGFKDELYTVIDYEASNGARAYMTAENPIIRAFAQFVFRIRAGLDTINRHPHLNGYLLSLLNYGLYRSDKIIDQSNRFLTPYLFALALEKKQGLERGESANQGFFSTRFLDAIMISCHGDDWACEIEVVYDLVLRISKASERILKYRVSRLIRKEQEIANRTIKAQYNVQIAFSRVREYHQKMIPLLTSKGIAFVPSLSKEKPLCDSLEEFRSLCTNYHCYVDYYRLSNLETEVALHQEKGPKKRIVKSSESATVSASAPREPSSEVCASGGGGGVGGAEGADAELEVSEVEEVARKFLIDHRVTIWEDPKAGLMYTRHDPTRPGALPISEMIKRHSVPIELIELALNPEFSAKGMWKTASGEEHDHWECLIYINGSRYIWEITSDDGRIYHSYARPIRVTSDCVMATQAVGEYPPLGSEKPSKIPLISTLSGVMAVKVGGNLMYTLNGCHYELVKLSG